MAVKNYLISGISGTGKSTICHKLVTMGFNAIDADDTFSLQVNSNWTWDTDTLNKILINTSDEIVFICGNASNRRDFIKRFDTVFILYIDDQTMTERLLNRTNNTFGNKKEDLEKMLKLNHERDSTNLDNKVFLSAMRPVDEIIKEILSSIGAPEGI